MAADKYNLQQLKAQCEESLIRCLFYENFIDVLLLADKHSADNLKREVLDFIAVNKPKLTDFRVSIDYLNNGHLGKI